jgi:TRAP-type C4-dicarboxylate transport system permease small subunit
MISALITLIIYLLVLGLLYWLVIYVVDTIPIPDPPARIIKIALMVLMVLVIIVLLLNMLGIGVGGDLRLPKLQ